MFSHQNSLRYGPNTEIDLVYTWVNGSDPQWRASKDHWKKQMGLISKSVANDARYVEHDELKYSLRSVAMHLPWIRNIYIITAGQVPAWLNVSHPKIILVDHEDIMPASALPTFDSEAIEANLANIKSLSEYFLYANDDFFIYRDLNKSYFFTDTGKIIIRIGQQEISDADEKRSVYFGNIRHSSRLINEHFGQNYTFIHVHNTVPYIKSYFLDAVNEFQKEFNETTHTKFRKRNSVQRVIVTYYTLLRNRAITVPNKHDGIQDSLVLWINTPDRLVSTVKRVNPSLLCINDRDVADQEQRSQLSIALSELFPVKAEWELD